MIKDSTVSKHEGEFVVVETDDWVAAATIHRTEDENGKPALVLHNGAPGRPQVVAIEDVVSIGSVDRSPYVVRPRVRTRRSRAA